MRSRVLLVLVAACAVAVAGLPATSQAGTVATEGHRAAAAGWVTVSGPVHSSAQPGLARLGSQLQVVWSQTDAGGTDSVRTRLLSAAGAVASPINPVVTGWLALVADPKVIGPAANRRSIFAGIRSAGPDAYTGPAVFASSTNGTTWSLGTGSLSKTTAAGSGGPSSNIAAIDAAGVPFFAKGGFDGGIYVHRGVDPTIPATADDIRSTDQNSAPVSVALARDRANGSVYVGWYSLGATVDNEAGTFVQRVWPQPNGALLKAPGSSNGSARSIGNDQPTALAERAGGGVWLAYLVGYPTSKTIRLWKVGTSTYFNISTGTKTASHLCLTPSTEGRLWLTWRTVSDHVLHAVRTNKAVSRLGAVQNVVQPLGLQTSVNLTACEGSLGPLTLVVNAKHPSSQTFIFAKQVVPALSASRSPRKLNKGTVTVTVRDAGDPVAGAKVKFRSRTYTTNAKGKALVKVGRAVPAKRYTISVSKAGYVGVRVTVKVT